MILVFKCKIFLIEGKRQANKFILKSIHKFKAITIKLY
jgi:hypothetical protein